MFMSDERKERRGADGRRGKEEGKTRSRSRRARREEAKRGGKREVRGEREKRRESARPESLTLTILAEGYESALVVLGNESHGLPDAYRGNSGFDSCHVLRLLVLEDTEVARR